MLLTGAHRAPVFLCVKRNFEGVLIVGWLMYILNEFIQGVDILKTS